MAERWIRDHFGSEVRPRGEFVRGLEAELSASWPAPAIAPAEADATRPDVSEVWDIYHANQERAPVRRRGTWLVAAAMVVLAGTGVVYVATSDRGGGVATAPGPTATGSMTTLSSTVPGDTAAAVDPGSTVVTTGVPSSGATTGTDDPVFDPACVPRAGVSTGGPSLPASAFDSLGALQPQPVLTIRLPRLRDPVHGNGSVYASARLSTGGVVITLQSFGDTTVDGVMTAMVAFDGTVRWVHCSVDGVGDSGPVPTDFVAVEPSPDPEGPLSDGIVVGSMVAGELIDGIAGVDSGGNVVWRRDGMQVNSAEGFTTQAVGDLTIVWGLIDVDATRFGAFALRTTTGETVWERESDGSVVLVDDGLVLISDGVLLDARTGEVVQTFADGVDFAITCCAGSDYHWLRSYGGVLVHNDYDTMRVWLPAALDLAPHEVSLP
jgi:hypothetical protein